MRNRTVSAAFLLLFGTIIYSPSALAGFVAPPPADSIGVEKKDGKRYILHRVDEGQTLFAIARRYGRSVAEIKAANPDMTKSVRYDQLVRIPIPDGALHRNQEKSIDKAIREEEKMQKRVAKSEQKASTKPDRVFSNDAKDAKRADDPARAGIHVVESGQTLYSLAVRYGVSQDDLRRWNSLGTDNVLIGQALIVSEKAYQSRTPSGPVPGATVKTPDTPARTTNRTVDVRPAEPKRSEVAKADPPKNETPAPKPERTAASTPEPRRTESEVPARNRPDAPATTSSTKPAEPEVELPRPGNDAPMPTHGRRLSDSGVAEMIEGGGGTGKYLALHRTAPIGTLVQVRNLFNNQSVWVKVIGRLPDTGVNDKIMVKLSAQAFAKLSPDDRRFRAEVSYIVR